MNSSIVNPPANRQVGTRAARHKVGLKCHAKLFGSSEHIVFSTFDISKSGIAMITNKDVIPYNSSSILEISIPSWEVDLVAIFVKKEHMGNRQILAVRIIEMPVESKFYEFLESLDEKDVFGEEAESVPKESQNQVEFS